MGPKFKHAAFDIIGFLLVIISPLLGWLPGPGGIPLLLAGLGFISVHHNWAKKLLVYVKQNGLRLGEQIFREHAGLQAIYDILSIVLTVSGVYLIATYTKSYTLAIAIVCVFTALTIFLGNRKRLESLRALLNKKFK